MSARIFKILLFVGQFALPLLNIGAIEYEYKPSSADPFVPQYSAPAKVATKGAAVGVSASHKYVLKGVWKSSDSPWKAIISQRPIELSDAAVEDNGQTQPKTVRVGDSLESGIKVVSIEDRGVWVVEKINLVDGRVFERKSKIDFDEEF